MRVVSEPIGIHSSIDEVDPELAKESAKSEYLDVSPSTDSGDDGEGPETDQRVWDWLVNQVHEDWSVEERIEYAKTIGRYDIVDALEGK